MAFTWFWCEAAPLVTKRGYGWYVVQTGTVAFGDRDCFGEGMVGGLFKDFL